jgi:hypothetical protein
MDDAPSVRTPAGADVNTHDHDQGEKDADCCAPQNGIVDTTFGHRRHHSLGGMTHDVDAGPEYEGGAVADAEQPP